MRAVFADDAGGALPSGACEDVAQSEAANADSNAGPGDEGRNSRSVAEVTGRKVKSHDQSPLDRDRNAARDEVTS